MFERDVKAIDMLNVPHDIIEHVEEHIKDCEKEMEDDAESIITTQRYEYIQRIIGSVFQRSRRRTSTTLSDKIDRIVTHRILALPIFILSLCAMWWLAVAEGGPGTKLTDWANDGFLGDGWHLPFTMHECKADGKYKGMEFEDAQSEFANGFSWSRQTKPYRSATWRSTSMMSMLWSHARLTSSNIGASSNWAGATSL